MGGKGSGGARRPVDCSPTNNVTMLGVTATWKQTTQPLPCARDARCRGIQVGEFYVELDDGRAVHAVGFCVDSEGNRVPPFPWDEEKSNP
jgi:hypothetical protein